MSAGARGFPGPRGPAGGGNKGDTGDSGITLTDNLDGSFTIATTNPPQSITFFNGAAGVTPIKGVDYFDGNTGNYISFVFAQVPAGNSAPTIDAGTGSYNGNIEIMPTGSATWVDDPVFTSGFDTYISKGEYVNDASTGLWTLKNNVWSNPVIFNKDVTDPQSKLVSYVFQRASSPPTDPTGGSYADPLPDGVAWTDGIPSGSLPVYFSKRLFTSDGLSPQESGWSPAVLLTENGQGTKFQFGPTNTGPWDDIPDETDEYMIICAQQIDGNFVCDTANPIKIKGEAGAAPQTQVKAFAFKRSVGNLVERPTGGDYNSPAPVDGVVSGWTTGIPPGSADLYISDRLFTSDGLAPQDPEWSESTLFSGQSAIQLRIEQSAYVWKFDKDGNNPYPNTVTFTAFKQNISQSTVWEIYEEDDSTVISTAAAKTGDTFSVTAAEFGTNNQIRVTATAGAYSDDVYVQRIQDGLQGPAGAATEIREVRFQFAPDNNGGSPPVTGWHDAPVLGTDRWLREGTFYDDVLQGSWSTGVKFVGDDGALTFVEFWFSPDGIDTPDQNGTTADWSKTQRASDFYVISQEFIAAVPQGWGAVVNIRGNDGVEGKYFETQFALADKDIPPQIDLTTPVAPDYDNTVQNPVGWTTDVGSLIPTGTEVIWAITATKNFDGTLDTNWTAAQQWGAYTPTKGNDFTDGLSGAHISNYFVSKATQPAAPSGGSWDGATETGVNFNAEAWVDDPMSPGTGEWVWRTQQVYTATIQPDGTNLFSAGGWSTPVRYAYVPTFGTDYFNGSDGADGASGKGTFTSYIFRNAVFAPSTPTGGTYNGTTETFPTDWTDDPTNPADDSFTIWVSKRVYEKPEGTTTWSVETDWSIPVAFSGNPPFIGYLTNASAVVNALANGTGYTLTGTNGVFECKYGDTEVTTNCDFNVSGETSDDGTYSIRAVNGLSFRINKTTGAYDLFGANWTSDQETFVVTSTYSVTSTVVSQKFIITKAKTGLTGADGAAGADGVDGQDGNTVANVTIYRRSSSLPSTPTGGDYNFTTNVLTAPTNWFSTIPAGTDPIYASVGIAAITGTTGSDTSIPWGSPQILAQNGVNGTNGSNGRSVYQANVYRRAASQPATPADDSASYNFTTNTLTPPGGWSVSPPGGSDPCWVSTTTFEIVGTTGTDSTQSWTTPAITFQNGQDGADGVDGADGIGANTVAQLTIYRRATSTPSTPTGGSYTFDNNTLTAPSGWSGTIPAGTDPIYATVGIASIFGTSGTDSSIPWGSPNLLAQNGSDGADGSDGATGTAGKSIYQATIFRRASSAPATPAANSASYNFGTNVLTPPANWFTSPPAGSDPLYSSVATFEVTGTTGTDSTQTWTAPELFVQDGSDGVDGVTGLSTYQFSIFRRSASAPTTPTGGSFNFTSNAGTAPTSWFTEPPAGTDPLYISQALASISGDTGTDSSLSWSSPALFVQDGNDGSDGLSTFQFSIFRRAASQPATPTGGSYNFGTNTPVAPTNWSVSVPSGTNPIWISQALASVQGDTGTDSSLSWTTPIEFVRNGADGADGVDGTSGNTVAQLTIYRRATSEPSAPTGGSYNFNTNVITPPTNWSNTIPAGTDPVYASVGLASIVGTIGSDSSIPWGAPNVLAQNGQDGADGAPGSEGTAGKSVFQASVFRRVASAPSTPTGGSYNFGTNALTAPTNWFSEPPAGSDPLYVSQATFEVVGTTGTDSSTTWSSPALFVQDGTDGAPGSDGTAGISTYKPLIFRRSASAPATPTGGSYNFGTNVLTEPSGWFDSPPANNGNPLWSSSALASIQGDTGIDSSLTWSAPAEVVRDGNDGLDGVDGVDGSDAINVRNQRQSVTIPADRDGTVLTNGYNEGYSAIEVFEGSTRLTPQSSDTGGNSIWWPLSETGQNITPGSPTTIINAEYYIYANPSNMTQNSASITYTIRCRRADGTLEDVTTVQSLSKSLAGLDVVYVTQTASAAGVPSGVTSGSPIAQTGTQIKVYEDAGSLTCDQIGTSNGTYKISIDEESFCTAGAVSAFFTHGKFDGITAISTATGFTPAFVVIKVEGKSNRGVSFVDYKSISYIRT